MATRTAKLSELTPDQRNANRGTQRGLKALDTSLRTLGAGRSILVDKHGRVIAGNKTLERSVDIGMEDVIIVQSDGTQLVAVQRTDLDLETDDQARQLAYADNRVGQLDLDWEPAQVLADMEAGLDLSSFFAEYELRMITGDTDADVNYDEAWQGMPEFEQESAGAVKSIIVHFQALDDIAVFSELVGQTVTEKTKSIWYPKKERSELLNYEVGNES